MPNLVDILGKKFGELQVIERVPREANAKGSSRWKVRCSCGNEFVTSLACLKSRVNPTCGCVPLEISEETRLAMSKKHIKHGHYKGDKASKTYTSWQAMWSRVTRPKDKRYKTYKDFTIQNSWCSFEEFLKDMGERPKGKTLDRIDNGLGYSKENCRWATIQQQNNNRSCCKTLEVGGVIKTYTQWSEAIGKSRSYIAASISRIGKENTIAIISKFLKVGD